ncbi:hypothetical protein DFJ74DRAFT_775635, partial [Hyaloraphidium curvatum]
GLPPRQGPTFHPAPSAARTRRDLRCDRLLPGSSSPHDLQPLLVARPHATLRLGCAAGVVPVPVRTARPVGRPCSPGRGEVRTPLHHGPRISPDPHPSSSLCSQAEPSAGVRCGRQGGGGLPGQPHPPRRGIADSPLPSFPPRPRFALPFPGPGGTCGFGGTRRWLLGTVIRLVCVWVAGAPPPPRDQQPGLPTRRRYVGVCGPPIGRVARGLRLLNGAASFALALFQPLQREVAPQPAAFPHQHA